MKPFQKYSGYVLGLIFLLSAISKLITIEIFEQFIFSLKILPLNSSIVLARLVVAFELIIGLFYILNLKNRLTSIITTISLIGFTAFIIYIETNGISDDCHCFGTTFQLSNIESIFKNIALLIIVAFNYKKQDSQKFVAIKIIATITLSLTISLAHHFPSHLVGIEPEIEYCKPCLTSFLEQQNLQNETKVICFISTKCKYCKLAAQKMTVINDKVKQEDKILYVLWDENHDASLFFNETKSAVFNSIDLNVLTFLQLTQGQMPLIVVLEKGKVIRTFRYQDIDESFLLQFLNRK